jgi:type II secretion system protein H
MRARSGYTVLELIIVMSLIGLVAAIVLPSMGRTLAQVRLQRAATMVASNVQLAQSLASRQRRPVRLSVDASQKVIRVRDYTNPATVYAEQWFDRTAENAVGRLEVTNTDIVIYPSGLYAEPFTFTLTTADKRRVISVSRAGQIRIEQ